MDEAIKRTEADGEVRVERDRSNETISVYVVSHGQEMLIRCTEWNARRVLGALSVILDLPLSAKANKQIRM